MNIPSANRVMRRVVGSILRRGRRLGAKRKARSLVRSGGSLWLELGAGDRRGSGGWVTIDLDLKPDITWDLLRGIPFPDASVSRIYSSHVLEHFAFGEIQSLLDECLRVLEPGGSISVCVPNARLFIEAYLGVGELDVDRYFRARATFNDTTGIDIVNYIAYMGGAHKYMWDQENLLQVLEDQGFRNARAREFDPTLDQPERDDGSIYAMAIK